MPASVIGKSIMQLCLGTVQFGQPYGVANVRGRVDQDEVKEILEFARSSGINMLDTAIAYGDAESVLGRIGVTDFKVLSKLPAVLNADEAAEKWILNQINYSRERLRVDRLYGLLLHNPDDLLGVNSDSIVSALSEAKERGWVEKIGISVYSPTQMDTLANYMAMDIVQIPLNIFDRRFESSGWLRKLRDRNVEIHARSVFLQGLLLMSPTSIPAIFRPYKHVLERWHNWLAAEDHVALQSCLAHVASYSEVSYCVVGCDSLRHCREIVEASRVPQSRAPDDLTTNELQLLNPALWGK